MKIQFVFLYIVLVSCSLSCKRVNNISIERAFYYWKNDERSIDSTEASYLSDLKIKKLYVKFFEVTPDSFYGAIPTAKTNLELYKGMSQHKDSIHLKLFSKIEYIPVIFIRNDVFDSISTNGIEQLAINIFDLTNKYYSERFSVSDSSLKEIQIDCDWTKRTKENYFSLLTALKRISNNKTISCTLRLYPYKFSKIMGIPPVDKVMLMCYNLISPLTKNENSILNNKELIKYIKPFKKYPMHIDFALPVYSWMQVYHNDRLAGIINPIKQDSTLLKQKDNLWYEIIKDKEIENFYLRIGDKIKLEETTSIEIEKTIDSLTKYVKIDKSTTISLFHLDDQNLKKYNNETLNHFFTDFTK